MTTDDLVRHQLVLPSTLGAFVGTVGQHRAGGRLTFIPEEGR